MANPYSKDAQVQGIRNSRRYLGDRLGRTRGAAPHPGPRRRAADRGQAAHPDPQDARRHPDRPVLARARRRRQPDRRPLRRRRGRRLRRRRRARLQRAGGHLPRRLHLQRPDRRSRRRRRRHLTRGCSIVPALRCLIRQPPMPLKSDGSFRPSIEGSQGLVNGLHQQSFRPVTVGTAHSAPPNPRCDKLDLFHQSGPAWALRAPGADRLSIDKCQGGSTVGQSPSIDSRGSVTIERIAAVLGVQSF